MAETTKRKVMIAIDGSPQAEAAFDWYFMYLHKPETTVILAHVPESPTVTSSDGIHLNAEELRKMSDQEKAETKSLQDKYLSKLADKNMGSLCKTLYGKPGEALVQAARELKASMVVMGTRGQGRLRRTLLGSVSDYVVHHANCPVVVCRH